MVTETRPIRNSDHLAAIFLFISLRSGTPMSSYISGRGPASCLRVANESSIAPTAARKARLAKITSLKPTKARSHVILAYVVGTAICGQGLSHASAKPSSSPNVGDLE